MQPEGESLKERGGRGGRPGGAARARARARAAVAAAAAALPKEKWGTCVPLMTWNNLMDHVSGEGGEGGEGGGGLGWGGVV